MKLNFDAHICQNLAESRRREWLETNGIGGYASSTLSGMNTRRYHALLLASLQPPTNRFVLLSKIDEAIIINNQRLEFATNEYGDGVIYPNGFNYQTNFRLDPFPISTFAFHHQTQLEKSIFMVQDENTVVVRYRLLKIEAAPFAMLELRPLVAFRDYHSLLRADESLPPMFDITSDLISITSTDDTLRLHIAHAAAANVQATNTWYRNFSYTEEQQRGFDFHENLFNPCQLTFQLHAGDSISLIASTEPRDASDADELEQRECERRKLEAARCSSDDEAIQILWSASQKYLVLRESDARDSMDAHDSPEQLQSVIAGYHWFADWGRDTMIALPGLTLATERFDSAREILLAFATYLDQGLIPNNFPDRGGAPAYNTVDATLWYVHAINDYVRRTDDKTTLDALYPHLLDIINWHIRGTHNNIRVDVDGLVRAGDATTQLTWMDAKIGDYVATPRNGRPVEIQALWYNALRIVENFANMRGDTPNAIRCAELAAQTARSFNRIFWNEAGGYLYDCIADDDTPDGSVRPNQIFAVSLPFQILTNNAQARRVVETVKRELLTPYGLRSLSPEDAKYRGRYEGDSWSRDTAYHQGTVWAWLIGAFITAYLNAYGRTPETIAQARTWTRDLREHLADDGLGHVAEIFDSDAPHAPRGCIAQAWSVAELLRCELEELHIEVKRKR